MTDPVVLQAQLDDLKRAYYSGATSIAYEGKSVTRMARGDLLLLIQSLERQLGIAAPPQRTVIRTQKGW